jgi:hypothetical protein
MNDRTMEEYWSLIKSTQEVTYPGFVQQLEHQSLAQQNSGRAAVFEFGDKPEPFPKIFFQFEALRDFLDNFRNGAEVRCVIVLEDLPRSFVEVLGSRLRIPPSFFGDHWVNPDSPFTRRTLRHQDPRRRFMLKWRKLHRATIVGQKEDGLDTYLISSTASRTVTGTSLGVSDGVTASSEKLSFWSAGSDGNSWPG